MKLPQICCSWRSDAANSSGVSNTGNWACCCSRAAVAGVFIARAMGEVNALTPEEADATRITNEGQAARPWQLWREQARRAQQERGNG